MRNSRLAVGDEWAFSALRHGFVSAQAAALSVTPRVALYPPGMTTLNNRDFDPEEQRDPAQFEEYAGDPPEASRTKSGKPRDVPPGQETDTDASDAAAAAREDDRQ